MLPPSLNYTKLVPLFAAFCDARAAISIESCRVQSKGNVNRYSNLSRGSCSPTIQRLMCVGLICDEKRLPHQLDARQKKDFILFFYFLFIVDHFS